ncbi:hypothetical protein GeomeDRAFT_1982 [Geobacter metallireducens RCH3]|uniref:Uncharacterized protein n=2 Tax=Geobacteraceae TaxID=213422 RepID=Q39UV1_GEOMG|nr:hypothetical protein Gmet_1742 [Geobacter metallireducens GS-15]EHP86315.1 hypothetical protein GeomeDRAFT_1982 [Geobacter metallireducens RCH3]MBT1074368.1 hypothetical protein [Geobacter grbiciae]
MTDEHDERRPLGLVLLTGLYLFFFVVTVSTYGSPFPFLGRIYLGTVAKALIFVDSLVCLYLFLGLMKRQNMTWYLLICYNLFEVINTIVNLTFITPAELERVIGERIDQEALMVNNIASALAILLLTQYIYRHKHYFTNSRKYLF